MPASIECGETIVTLYYSTEHEAWEFLAWLHQQTMKQRQISPYRRRASLMRQSEPVPALMAAK